MNAGMFGHPGGLSAGGTRSIVSYGTQIGLSADPTLTINGPIRGIRVTGASATWNVRTRLYAAIGKGACKFFVLEHAAGSDQTVLVEMVVDGVTIASKSVSISSGGSALAVGCYSPSPSYGYSLDYVPFNTSFEVYVTNSTNTTTYNYAYNVDAHQ